MKHDRPPAPDARRTEAPLLGLAADTSLRDDPRLLHDPDRLGALHAELQSALGAADAAATLLQAGFLRGLRDARQASREPARRPADEGGLGLPAPLRLALELLPSSPPDAPAPADGPDLEGTWREGHEASGRVARLGPAETPSCWTSTGYTSGWLTGLLDVDLLAVELECAGCGAERCRFRVRTPEAWRAVGDPRAAGILECLDVAQLRAAVISQERPPAPADGELDPEAAAVHVWGPVMVIPFGGPDESLAALELIGRDESARDVSVVVVDLGGAILDEGWGAVALERVLDAVESWGAEAVLTGISPLSAAVVEDLAARHVVLHKELPEAVAAAFQIADAQRRVY